MPVINDAVVVNSAYDTSGNGGRRIVQLSNGYLVSILTNLNSEPTNRREVRIFYSKDRGNTWIYGGGRGLETTSAGSRFDVSAISKGNYVYLIYSREIGVECLILDFNTGSLVFVSPSAQTVDSSQTATGNVSLAINEAGRELHAAWASKNSAYPNSFNIRYAKGTIATDGSVVWGLVEQVTNYNYSSDPNFAINPVVTLDKNEIPLIVVEQQGVIFSGAGALNSHGVTLLRRDSLLSTNTNLKSNWTYKNFYNGGSYIQSAPSAIFVPQRINGLANGLMGVAWHGTDSTHTTINHVRFSYSLDGGLTWSTIQKLFPGQNASLSATRTGKLFITFDYLGDVRRIESSNNGVSWSQTGTDIGTGSNPSSLLDLTMNPTVPLTIYKGASSVKFSGSWTTVTNSVPSGDIGQKTSKDNLLTYAITTEGTMSTITEKVNGVTVGTKTATSGQSLTVALTQAQWDAVKYGKYANTSGARNTITVEMGTEVWTYTFDKIPPVDAQITELLKSHIDSADVAIPAKKALLGASIRGKGGTVNDTDSLEVMASAIAGIQLGKKWASGTIFATGGNIITVSGLSFRPSTVILYMTTANNDTVTFRGIGVYKDSPVMDRSSGSDSSGLYGMSWYSSGSLQTISTSPMASNGFSMSFTANAGVPIAWEAYE